MKIIDSPAHDHVALSGPAVLVPVALEALTIRPDASDFITNPLFTDAGPGPTTFTGSGESTGSAAAAWQAINDDAAGTTTTELLASDAANPTRLHVSTNLPGSGVIQHLPSDLGRRATIITATLYVTRGDVVVAVDGTQALGLHAEAGPVGELVGTNGQWHTITTLYDDGVPGAIAFVTAPEAGTGADFWVTEVTARAFDDGNLVENGGFGATGATTVQGGDVESPSSAMAWTIRHVAAATTDSTTTDLTDDPAPPAGQARQVLRCQTTGPGCGLRQRLLSGGVSPAGVQASIRLFVQSGTVAISCGLDRDTGAISASPSAPAGWQTLVIPQASPPASIDAWATSAGGASFLVDEAWVQPNALDQCLANPGFDDPADPSAPGQPVTVGPSTDGHSYAGGWSAATHWSVWNNSGDAVTTTQLVSTTRPGGTGDMLHLTATRGGCGLVQGFLPYPLSGGPRQIEAAVWVYLNSGSVVIGTGNGGHTNQDAMTTTTGQWELVTAPNGVWPTNEFIIYAGEDDSDFYVDVAQLAEIGAWTPTAETQLADPTSATASGSFDLRPAPFANLPSGRPVGAHLMWALPDALAQADAITDATTGSVTFGPIPDRWLVCRLAGTGQPTTQPASRAVTVWLLSTDDSGTPVVTPLDVTSTVASGGSQTPTATPPTVLGPGDVTWSATYDNIINRLAFHDPLTDVEGPLAYLVAGWHSNAGDDPIGRGLGLDDLQWDAGSPAPDVTHAVYHGSAVSIGWRDQGWSGDADGALSQPVDNRPVATDLYATLTTTLVDGLTALLATPTETDAQKQALTAFLIGAAGTLDTPDGAATVAAALHGTGFGSAATTPGGETIWQASPQGAASDGGFQAVARSNPRLFTPGDPIVLVQGAGRSFAYGGDGRYDDSQGRLACRVTGETIVTLGPAADGPIAPSLVLSGFPSDQTLPSETQALLTELAALDPGSAPGDTSPSPAQARTSWWLTWDPSLPAVTLAPVGTLPSPIAVTAPTLAWTPVMLDWTVDYIPADATPTAWVIDGPELTVPTDGLALDPEATTTHNGSTALGASPAALLGTASTTAVEWLTAAGDDPTEVDATLESTLAKADIVGGALTGLTAQLRGDDVRPVVQLPGDAPAAAAPATPPDTTVRSGQLVLARVRIVDAYGQTVELPKRVLGAAASPTSSGTGASDPTMGVAAAGGLTLAPRLTSPAQLVFRYVDADGTGIVADDSVSPVCGYLMTDFESQAINLFAADGSALGRLTTSAGNATAWQATPGTTTSVGASPSTMIADPSLAGIAERMLDHDTLGTAGGATGLGAMLTAIDTARFTIGLLPVGDEHLALLLGQPAVIYRASLTMNIDEPTPPPDLDTLAIEVQLGALDRLQDGLLGYYVDGDFTRLRVPPGLTDLAAELATASTTGALTDTYINSDPLYIRPGQTLDLVLFVEPSADVHVTAGLLPQKSIGQRRGWIDQAMHHLTPSLAVGPVLMDSTQAALPLPTDIHGTWTWARRPDPLSWQTDSVVAATDTGLGTAPLVAQSGWLQIELSAEQTWDDFGTPVTIKYLTMTDRDLPGAVPTAVGGDNADGTGAWTLTVDDIAALIETGRVMCSMDPTTDGNPSCPTPNPPVPVEITVTTNNLDQTTLTTATDQDPTNHLLELPEPLVYATPGNTNTLWDPIWDPDYTPADCSLWWTHWALINENSGLTLDLAGGPPAFDAGTPMQQWETIPGESNQQFQFIWTDHSYFTIIPWNRTDKCLEVKDASLDDGAQVQLAVPTGALNQQFQLVSRDGYISFLARHSGKALTIIGVDAYGNPIPDTEHGAMCQQATCQGLATQRWTPVQGDMGQNWYDAAPGKALLAPTGPYYAFQPYTIEVAFSNTGNATWTDGAASNSSGEQLIVPIGGLSTSLEVFNQVGIPIKTSPLAPRGQIQQYFTIQMPTDGPLTGGFSMATLAANGTVSTFGTPLMVDSMNIQVLYPTGLDALSTIVAPNPVPPQMSPNQTLALSVSIQNTGSLTLRWPLVTVVHDPSLTSYNWDVRLQPPASTSTTIAPGQSVVWTVEITAGAEGQHLLRLLTSLHGWGAFGEASEHAITVGPPPPPPPPPPECAALAEQLTELQAELRTAAGQDKSQIIRQIAQVETQMQKLGCPP
jgi:hypothetical protein